MTRRRKFSLISRVCIGMFLLLFGDVRPIEITTSPTFMEKLQATNPVSVTNRTFLSKLSSTDSSESISSSHEDNSRTVQSTRSEDTKSERIHINDFANSSERTGLDKEKGVTTNVTPLTHDERHVTRLNEQPSTSERRSRFGELISKSSGKSTSTKTISEDTLRLTRTNGLNTATTKPALDDIVAKYEEKKNRSTLSQLEITEEYDNIDELKRTSRDREPITASSRLMEEDKEERRKEEDKVKKKKKNVDSKSEEKEEEYEGGEEIEEDEAISLINDTNVNYNHFYKTLNSKNHDPPNQSSQSEKNSSSVPNNNEAGNLDPKEEVEVIKNMTNKPLLKIVMDNSSIWNRTSIEKRDQKDREDNELIDKEQTNIEIREKKNHYNVSSENESDSSKKNDSGFMEDSSKENSRTGDLSKESGQTSSMEVTTSKSGEMEVLRTSTSSGNPIAMPKGRTIAFSGVNEFPNIEIKSTAVPIKEVDSGHDKNSENPVPKKNSSIEKTIEQKPYPYVKSTKDSSEILREKTTSSPKMIVRTTETTTIETSAYENTIGRSETKKKFVVTEPSVVLENSIQQVKPLYGKTQGNDSWINSTTESQSLFSVTTSSLSILNDINQSNETFNQKITTETKLKDDKSEDKASKVSSAENDVPQGNVNDKKEITGNDANFDVTGNGITEVSPRVEGITKEEPNYRTAFYSDQPFNKNTNSEVKSSPTETPQADSNAISMKMDIQTDAEEAMLIRSTLNVTEVFTEFPLTKAKLADETKQATAITTSPNTLISSVEASTVTPLTSLEQNKQNTVFVGTGNITTAALRTSEPDKTTDVESMKVTASINEMDTTTSKVEYEFVGLTETTILPEHEDTTERISTSPSLSNITIDTSATEQSEDSTTQSFPISNDISSTSFPNTAVTFQTPNDAETTTVADQLLTTTVVASQTSSLTSDDETTMLETETDSPSTQSSIDQRTISASNFSTTTEEDVFSTTVTESSTEFNKEDTTMNVEDSSSSVITGESSHSAETTSTISSSTSETTEHSDSATDDVSPHFVPYSPSFTTPSMTGEPTTFETNTSTPPTTASTHEPTPFVPVIPVTGTVPSGTLKPRFKPTTRPTSTAELPTEKTGDGTKALSPEEITLLVRIVIEGTTREVCPHIDILKRYLAEILTTGMDRLVSPKQVMFHQNPCLEAPTPAPTPTDISLTSILVYVVDEDGKFDAAMTKNLPNLYKRSPINFPITIHSFLLVQETDSGNAIAVVVVSSVAFICLVLLAGLLFIMRKRQTRFNYGERCRPVSLDAYSLDSVSAYNSVRRKGAARSSKRSYGNPTFEDSSAIPSHPLNFAGLSSFCNDVTAINEEFTGIPQVTAKIDELPPGAEVKNRYANVIPLPETRVLLQKLNNDPLTEYINASYVRGPKNATKYYIACQAPMESTVTDFWRMIWEQQSKVIIMLTDLVENDVEKCTEYIPPSEVTDCHRLYGDYQVTLKKRETKEKYAISTLHLKNLENNTFREVYHIWYLWPVNGVQSDGAGLIAILLEARALQRGGPGPIVVHCSPGTGRTGTLIALDLGIRQYEITRTVDVPRVVYTIRRDRAGAVQTKEQYAFIYKALNLYATKLAGGVLEST